MKKALIWMVLSTILFGVLALLNAALVVLFLNFAGVAALSSLGYWQVYWLLWVIMYAFSAPVAFVQANRDYNGQN